MSNANAPVRGALRLSNVIPGLALKIRGPEEGCYTTVPSDGRKAMRREKEPVSKTIGFAMGW